MDRSIKQKSPLININLKGRNGNHIRTILSTGPPYLPKLNIFVFSASKIISIIDWEVISNIFSDHSAKKMEINYKESAEKLNTWKLKNILLDKPADQRKHLIIKILGNKGK